MKSPGGDMEADSPDTEKKRRRPHAADWAAGDGTWTSTYVLVGILTLLFLTIWTLPAPTFFGKLGLLRQSWRINAVLDESQQLREQLTGIQKTRADLEKELSIQSVRAKDLHRRLDSSGGETVSLRRQVADEQVMVSGLQGSNTQLEAEFQKRKASRLSLLHKLQSVKTAEMKDLAGLESIQLLTDAPGTDSSTSMAAGPTTTASAQATKSTTQTVR